MDLLATTFQAVHARVLGQGMLEIIEKLKASIAELEWLTAKLNSVKLCF